MRINKKELKDLDEIKAVYCDEIREQNLAVNINGFVVSGVSRFKISGDIIIVCDARQNELARICIDTIKYVEIDEQFGDYKFVLNE